MPNIRYIAVDLEPFIQNQFYQISQDILTTIENFSSFEQEQIHMTICFLGDVDKRIKTNKKDFYNKLNYDIENFLSEQIILEFDSYKLFGSKNNLIVAKFKLCEQDKNKIIEFKQHCSKNYGSPSENYFVPHITLEKILNFNNNLDFDIDKLNIPKPKIPIITLEKLKLV